MKAFIVCLSASIAILLMVALMPASGWVFKNSLDMLRGNDLVDYGNDVAYRFAPRWLTDPSTYTGKDAPEELMRALLLHDRPRIDGLHEYATAHPNDPLAWAVAARMACMYNGPAPDEPNKLDPSDWSAAKSAFATGLEESIKGEHVEPDNAYFPLLRAVFDMYLGHLDDMQQALHAAAYKPHYNNHAIDQGLAMEQAELSAKGYRGEIIKTFADASILFPDLSRMKQLAKFLNRRGSLQEKRDMVQISALMGNDGSTIIEMLVACADLRIIVSPPRPLNSNWHPMSDEEYRRRVAAFQDQLAKNGVPPTVPSVPEISNILDRLSKASKQYVDSMPSIYEEFGSDEQSFKVAFLETIAPTMFLVAFAISAFSAIGAWLFSLIESETFRRMLPHLLCLPMWWLVVLFETDSPIVNAGLFLGLIQLFLAFLYLKKTPAFVLTLVGVLGVLGLILRSTAATWMTLPEAGLLVCAILIAAFPWFSPVERRSQIAPYAGALLVVVSFFAGFADGGMAAPLGGFVYVLARLFLWQKESGEPRKWTLVAVSVLLPILVVAAACFYIWRLGPNNGLWAPVLGALLIMLPGAAFFTGKPVSLVRVVASVSFVTVSALYLVATGLEVRANHQASLSTMNLLHEAANVRKLAGV